MGQCPLQPDQRQGDAGKQPDPGTVPNRLHAPRCHHRRAALPVQEAPEQIMQRLRPFSYRQVSENGMADWMRLTPGRHDNPGRVDRLNELRIQPARLSERKQQPAGDVVSQRCQSWAESDESRDLPRKVSGSSLAAGGSQPGERRRERRPAGERRSRQPVTVHPRVAERSAGSWRPGSHCCSGRSCPAVAPPGHPPHQCHGVLAPGDKCPR